MNEIVVSPIKKWQSLFEEQPLEALDRLLLGRAYMGVLNRNDTNEILYRLFHTRTKAQLDVLDNAIKDWFVKYWESTPPSISIQRWNEVLRNAFSIVIRLNLTKVQTWLFENYQQTRVWLYGLYLGPDSDPEADLLRLLALSQRDQSLLPLWMRLCRLEEDRPLHFADVGLLGLQKLPDINGEPLGDIHPAVFSGIVDLARTIAKQVRPKSEGRDFWFLKVRAIMARYPRSSQYWTEHFLPLLPSDPKSTESKWLGQLIPKIKQDFETSKKATIASTRDLVMPSFQEFGVIRNLIEKCSLEDIRSRLETFLKKHENYAFETGFADILVKVFSEVAYKILRQDPEWALTLVQKAFTWAPYDPFLWTERAKIEIYIGRENRAIELLWEAKRKFPENPHIRTDLGEMLIKSGRLNIAKIVYQQAIEDFPTNAVCRTGLAVILLIKGDKEQSIDLLKKTIQQFPYDPVAKSILQKIEEEPEDQSAILEILDELKKEVQETEKIIEDKDLIPLMDDSIKTSIDGKDLEQESEMPAILKDTDEEREIEKTSMENIVVSDKSSEQAISELPTNGNGSYETQLGLANLYRLASRRAKGIEREQYEIEFKKACDRILAEHPSSVFGLLEKGFWMLEQDSQNAKQYFAQYSQNGNKTRVLGFRIGYILAKIQRDEKVAPEEWKRLTIEFPTRKLLITYENVRQELNQSNGATLSTLEALRKEIRKNLEVLPGTLRKNEEWLRSSLSERLFKDIDLKSQITKTDLPRIIGNHTQNSPILQGIIEQSLVNF